MRKRAIRSTIESDNQIEMENARRCRIFLLSPAFAGGERARMITERQGGIRTGEEIARQTRRADRGSVHLSQRPLFSR